MDNIREKHLLCRTGLWSFSKLSKQEDAKSSFFLQNQARTIQTHKTVFENSFLAMFISQVSSKVRDKHCQITRISILIFKHCFMGQYIESVVMLPFRDFRATKKLLIAKFDCTFLPTQSILEYYSVLW